ncbi:hypothetical protein AAC387_Pa04g1787 [Persea americana]
MKVLRLWQSRSRTRTCLWDGAIHADKMKALQIIGILVTIMLYVVYRTTVFQHHHAKMEERFHPFDTVEEFHETSINVDFLPRGIVHSSSDMELKPLWMTRDAKSKENVQNVQSHQNLLAIPAGIKQMQNVDAIVKKFLSENFTVILFHYDGKVNEWHDLQWSDKAIHVLAYNQTKWWFAKRFLHPDVVHIYDYIFLWDEDLGVESFHPGRYLKIMKSEGLEISQPALDPSLSEVHHKITIRKKNRKVHRRIFDSRGSVKCSDASDGPPCTGWVEGMAPVFSRSAWRCAWHLIQNDLVHGWGLDMKFGYCAQGDRTKKVGVIDSEFIIHQGIQSLGGSHTKKVSNSFPSDTIQRRRGAPLNMRSEIRRQSSSELEIFQQRWDQALREDKQWVYPFQHHTKKRKRQ